MTDSPAALVYARALLEAAGDDAPTVADEVGALAALATDAPQQWESLVAPEVTSAQRKQALTTVFRSGTSTTRNFLNVLVDRGRLEELPAIAAQYARLVQERQNQLDVRVTTAVELADDLRAKLESRLSASTGKQVRLHASVDPSIIGGLVIAHGDTLVDTSLRGRLDNLRIALKRGRLTPSSTSD